MDICLIGNGFDLHHNFPTSYYDFLQTVDFLINNYNSSFNTIEKVFGDVRLQESDKNISKAFEKHNGIYGLVVLEESLIKNIIDRAKNNLWFKYLNNCVNKDIGWIDFEKEIITVINAFASFFKDENNKMSLYNDDIYFNIDYFPEEPTDNFIVRQFDFFHENFNELSTSGAFIKIKNQYITQNLKNSGIYWLNEEKIIGDLYAGLRELADILKGYLYHFIDLPICKMKEMNIKTQCASYPREPHVFTFNYTNTFEVLYSETSVLHIHGSNKSNIVLGVNPDENDEIYNIDTSFLQFKKYYQRIFYRSDYEYINKVKFLRRTGKYDNGFTLYVIGHSLDTTDEDIIKELFALANRIIILYHSEERIGSFIKNLVNIYGKNEFDDIRAEKNLQFLPQAEVEWIYPK